MCQSPITIMKDGAALKLIKEANFANLANMHKTFNSKLFLIITCLFYTLFAMTLIQPENLGDKITKKNYFGKHQRHILRVWRMGVADAKRPFFEVKDRFLFHKRNPGFFKAMAELTARSGATSPRPLQVLLILLTNIGIIAMYKWLKLLFKSEIFPLVGLGLVLGTSVVTYFTVTIHQHPYNFALFNICVYFIVRFTEKGKWGWFAAAWVSYFLLCQNYYMFWVSTFIMMVGVMKHRGYRIISLRNFILGLAPVITVILVVIQVSHVYGGLDKGINEVAVSAKARAAGAVEGHSIKGKMDLNNWVHYPWRISRRIETYYVIPGFAFIFLAMLLWWLKRKNNSALDYRVFYYAFPAGMSWYVLMPQHSDIHVVVGRYSFFLWVIFFGFFFSEIKTYIANKHGRVAPWRFVKYTWPILAIYLFHGFFYVNLFHFGKNIVRSVSYQLDKRDALNGDAFKALRIQANRFAADYHVIPDQVLAGYKDMNLSVGERISVIRKECKDDKCYFLFENNGGSYKELQVDGKRWDSIYPNENVHAWSYLRYPVAIIDKNKLGNDIDIRLVK